MSMSRRARREWRIILWVSLVSAIVSAFFGVRVGPADEWWLRSATHGAIYSLAIATPIVLFQLKGDQLAFMRRLRRRPLTVYFAFKVLFYFIVIVGGLLIVRLLLSDDFATYINFSPVFRQSLVFSIVMSVVGTLFFEAGGLLTTVKITNVPIGGTTFVHHQATGGSIEGAFNVDLVKGFRVLANGVWGAGNGRYLTGLGPQAVVRPIQTGVGPALGHHDRHVRRAVPGRARRVRRRSQLGLGPCRDRRGLRDDRRVHSARPPPPSRRTVLPARTAPAGAAAIPRPADGNWDRPPQRRFSESRERPAHRPDQGDVHRESRGGSARCASEHRASTTCCTAVAGPKRSASACRLRLPYRALALTGPDAEPHSPHSPASLPGEPARRPYSYRQPA